MKHTSVRTAIAVPAALCLALGGALFMAGPANAAGADLSIATPTATTAVAGNPVAFSGAGLPTGDGLVVSYQGGADGTTAETTTPTVSVDPSTSAWTAPVTFDATAPGQTTVAYSAQPVITATGEPDGSPVSGTFTFSTAPVTAPVAAATLAVSPTSDTIEAATSTGFDISAANFTPDEALTLSVVDPTGKDVTPTGSQPLVAAADGTFTGHGALPAGSIGGVYTVTVVGTVSAAKASAEVAVLGDPTITGPKQGAKLVGTSVTFTGTGTPGAAIDIFIASTEDFQPITPADLDALSSQSAQSSMARLVSPKATGTAAAPVDQFVVAADGTWTGTVTDVPAGDYTFQAIAGNLDASGTVITNEDGQPQLTVSDPNAPVSFSIAAAAATTTAATGGTGTDGQLAFTGSQDTTPAAIAAGILMLLGTALTVVARRRRRSIEG